MKKFSVLQRENGQFLMYIFSFSSLFFFPFMFIETSVTVTSPPSPPPPPPPPPHKKKKKKKIYDLLLGDVNTVLRAQNATLAKSGQNKFERALCGYQGKTPTQKYWLYRVTDVVGL